MNLALFHHETRRCLANRATPLFLSAGWVFTLLLVFVYGGFIAQGEASFTLLFSTLPWVLALLMPLLTMAQADAGRKGLTERLNTLPLSPTHRLFGPFGFWALVLGFWLVGFWPFVATVAYLGTPDYGPLLTGFASFWLLAATLWALNMAIATRATTPAGATVSNLLVNLALCLPGLPMVAEWAPTLMPPHLFHILANLTPVAAASQLASGALTVSAIATLIAWLSGSLLVLLLVQTPRPWAHRIVLKPAFALATLTAITLALAATPAASFWQADATFSRTFTLSTAARAVLANLPEPLTLTLYTSRHNPDAPATLAPATQALTALLQRIRAQNPSRIFTSVVTADASPQAAYQALAAGVDEQSTPSGTGFFLGLTAQTPGHSGTLSQLDPTRSAFFTADVLTLITQTLRPSQPEIVLLTSAPARTTLLQKALAPLGALTVLPAPATNLGAEAPEDPLAAFSTSPSLIILESDPLLPSTTLAGLQTYLAGGGQVILLSNPVSPAPTPSLTAFQPFSALLPTYGLTLRADVRVEDLTTATLLAPGATQATGVGANPRWQTLKAANANPRLPFTANLQPLLWPESGIIQKTDTLQPLPYTPVLSTSAQASLTHTMPDTPVILAPYTLAALVTGPFPASGTTPTQVGTLLAFAPSMWLEHNVLSASPANLSFLADTAAFLLADPTFSALHAQQPPRTLTRINRMVSNVVLRNTPAEQQLENHLQTLTTTLQTLAPHSNAYLQTMQQAFETRQQIRTLRQQSIQHIRMLEDALLLINLLTMPLVLGLTLLLLRRR